MCFGRRHFRIRELVNEIGWSYWGIALTVKDAQRGEETFRVILACKSRLYRPRALEIEDILPQLRVLETRYTRATYIVDHNRLICEDIFKFPRH